MNGFDTNYFRNIDSNRNKFYYARIAILGQNDKIIKTIEGKVQPGSSISINSNSNIRRTCNLTIIATDDKNDLTDIDNYLSINKKIKISVGIETFIDFSKIINVQTEEIPIPYIQGQIYYIIEKNVYYIWTGQKFEIIESIYDYTNTIWFPLGVYVITQPNIVKNTNSYCTISLSCKDKMCLLNGEMGGGFPTSITFHEYDQIIGLIDCNDKGLAPWDDTSFLPNDHTIYKWENQYYIWEEKYGYTETDNSKIGQTISKPQLIYDIIKTVVINYGMESASNIIINDVPTEIKQLVRYTGSNPLYYNPANGDYTTDKTQTQTEEDPVYLEEYRYNEDVGYVYTDFTYPGTLITNIGDNVCTVLDKIKNTLGNFEYFYDVDGNFIFQEIKNYLNKSYIPTEKEHETQIYYLSNARNPERFSEGWELSANDLKIIGADNYKTDYYAGNQNSVYIFEEGNGLITSYSNSPVYTKIKNDYHIWGKSKDGYAIHYHLAIKEPPIPPYKARSITFLKNADGKYNGKIRLSKEGDDPLDIKNDYIPLDWRAELYLQGLEISAAGNRPDIFQQELLDLFDSIYEWGYYDEYNEWVDNEGRFKDISKQPNNLRYFFDYLKPRDNLYGISIDNINPKTFSYQQDKIVKLYTTDTPDRILIDRSMDPDYFNNLMAKCDKQGQNRSVISHNLYKCLAIGTIGYSAEEVMRDNLYQYTSYNESITLQSIPIYYLDANSRITVRDPKTGINGDYIIQSISLPLIPTSTMSITATRALQRI